MSRIALSLGMCFLGLQAFITIAVAQPDVRERPEDLWRAGPHLSPFQAVQWDENSTPQVKVGDVWYELVSLNDLPADQIISWCMALDDKDWQKRFEEDLPEVLIRMGHDPGKSVKLTVKKLENGEQKVLEKVAMTEENRRAVMEARRRAAATQPASKP